VELTLLPLAALLVLLSGISGPVRSGVRQAGSMAIMREILGVPRTGSRRVAPGTAQNRQNRAASDHCQPGSRSYNSRVVQARTAAEQALANFDRAPRKLYRTRFGHPDGAYLATAPPAGRRV
jgi:hypothetical protein